MTTQKSFKRRVRERMSKTGERYAAARTQVAQQRDRVQSARAKQADTADRPPTDRRPSDDRPSADRRPSDDKVEAATGKRWQEWFAILDRWGATQRQRGETVAFLTEHQGVAGWWAQTITMCYQRERGLRLKHQQADGFTISASRTVAVPAGVAFDAFVDPRVRSRWLPDASMSLRTSQPGRTARFDWGDGATRVNVSFDSKGPAKTTVAVAHERLPDPDRAEAQKAAWRERLTRLKAFLES